MNQTNIDGVNLHLARITEAVERLKEAVIILSDGFDNLDSAIETVEIYTGMVGAYMIEEERKEQIRNASTGDS